MATTATNKQPLLIDRVFHNAVEGNTLSSGSDTSLDILGTNTSSVLVDCTGNDGGIVEDLYAIARTSSSATYKVLFYLSSSVDYLRPGEGIYIASVESSDTSMPCCLASWHLLLVLEMSRSYRLCTYLKVKLFGRHFSLLVK